MKSQDFRAWKDHTNCFKLKKCAPPKLMISPKVIQWINDDVRN